MIAVLFVVLFLCMFFIGGDRGVISFISLCGNLLILLLCILLMYIGLPPVLVTLAGCIFISILTLFYQNGKNEKTLASFISVMAVLFLLLLLIFPISTSSHIQGFSDEQRQEDELVGLSTDIGVSLFDVATSMIIIGLIGAVLDVSIAVSSSVFEVERNNPGLKRSELYRSGIKVGGDLIGTTANTLLFAYFSEFFMLFLRFKKGNSSLVSILNSKAFCQEFICIIFSGIGCILIIPITSAVMAWILTRKKNEHDSSVV